MRVLLTSIIFCACLIILSAQNISISKEQLKSKVVFLTSDELAGRLPGTEGYNKAAKFAADIFSSAGIEAFGDSSYYQFLEVESNEIKEPIEFSLINNDRKVVFELGKHYIFRGFTGSGDLTAEVAFCGYGISRPDLGYDDYANIDVNDKVVIVFKYNPSWKIKDSTWGTNYPREKSTTAFSKGAKGIIFISFPNDKTPQDPIGSVLHGSGKQIADFPQLHSSLNAAEKFFVNSEYSLKNLQSIIDSTKLPKSLSLKTKAIIKVNADYNEKSKTMHVVGLLKGTDEILKDEYIIVGAHLDHVGMQGDSLYFPGANDNASGTAAVLSLAESLANTKTKRSIIFVLIASEEQGLFGADHFAKNLPIKQEKIVAMLNLDCIAYGDSIQIGNGKSAPLLWQLTSKIDSENDKMMVKRTWSGGGADATPFHKNGIPCLYFVTTNSYEHLHKLSDKAETLNYDLYEKISNLALKTIVKIGNGFYKREIIN